MIFHNDMLSCAARGKLSLIRPYLAKYLSISCQNVVEQHYWLLKRANRRRQIAQSYCTRNQNNCTARSI